MKQIDKDFYKIERLYQQKEIKKDKQFEILNFCEYTKKTQKILKKLEQEIHFLENKIENLTNEFNKKYEEGVR